MDERDNNESATGVDELIATFVRDLESLAQMLYASMANLVAVSTSEGESLREFAEHYGEWIEYAENERGYGYFKFDNKYEAQAERLFRRRERLSRGFVLVPQSFIVSLISTFDAHVGTFISYMYTSRPELLDASQRSLTFAELKSFDSLKAATDHILGKEVEALLRQSHSEQFAYLEKRFNIKLREGLPSWPKFVEITQRRNCFVHSGGAASEQYFKVCREHGVSLEPTLAIGDILDVTPSYFNDAYYCLFEIGVKLAQVLWRKIIPSEIDEADQSLSSTIFNLLSECRWSLAVNLSDFSCLTIKKHASEQNQRICLINRAQAYKWSGKPENCLKILNSQDWSAANDAFLLAQQVLRDDFSAAAATMRKIGAAGEIREEDYAHWPLFRDFRKNDLFLSAFMDVFQKPFADPSRIFFPNNERITRASLEEAKTLWDNETPSVNLTKEPISKT